MEFTKTVLILFVIMATLGSSMAVVYQVGDSDGWIINVDYSKWSNDKRFQVGDTLVFQYDPKYHNVIQVSKEDYNSCTATSPLGTYNSGKDSIDLFSEGEYYYICGFPGHCDDDQKLKIRVKSGGRDCQKGSVGDNREPSSSSNLTSKCLATTIFGLTFILDYFLCFP